MWRRALLAAAAVSYLICVLIMSGTQKEDLDLSMLGKLQRYNVNFDDINNEKIRQQCFSRNNNFTTDDQTDKMKENYVSTKKYKATMTTKDPLSSSLNMDTVINYLKSRENLVRNWDETTTGKTTGTPEEMVTSVAEHNENQSKIDMDLLRRYVQLETQKKSFYKLNDNTETNKPYKTIDLQTNERNAKVADDAAFIDKLLKDYIFKQQKISTTTEHTTLRYAINIQDIYKQIDEIISNGSNADNKDSKIVENYPNKSGQYNTKFDVIRPVQIMQSSRRSPSAEKQLFDSFYNFLKQMKQFKNNSSHPFPPYDDNVYSEDKTQNDKLLTIPFNQNHQQKRKKSTIYHPKSEIESNQKTLTPSFVKEIAETVKEVIMKDLRNELSGIYTKTTETTTHTTPTAIKTTTEISPIAISKNITQEKDLSIMDKFMDLYEQIKSSKQAKFSMTPNKQSAAYINNLNKSNKSHVKSAMLMPPVKRLQIPETNVYISSIGNYDTKPFFNINSHRRRKENNHRLPITIQTNSIEIQPLAIPVSKPEGLIRQNIVVHPERHLQDSRDSHQNHFPLRGNRYSDLDIPIIKHKNRTYKHIALKRNDGYNLERYPLHNLQEPKQTEDIIRFRMRDNGDSRLDTDYYEKINFDNDPNGVNEKHGIFNNHNIPRFHERLESVDTGSDGMAAVPDIDITGKQEQNANFPSRHQVSLVDMKKGSSYDETHFKNFLKTQQKVTDMLERILANRSKTNMPRSVETV